MGGIETAQVGEGLVRAVKSLYIECEARVKVGEKAFGVV